jgi:hypothetical protein
MSHTTINARYAKIIVILLLAVLLFLCGLLINQYRHIERQNYVTSYKNVIESLRHKKPLTASDVDVVLPWMTFRYINTIFKLPTNYLKDTLHISSSRYPNISLSSYSKSQKIDVSLFINLLKKAVSDYLISQSRF